MLVTTVADVITTNSGVIVLLYSNINQNLLGMPFNGCVYVEIIQGMYILMAVLLCLVTIWQCIHMTVVKK